MKRMVNLENFKDFCFYKKFLFLFTLFLPIYLFSQQKNSVSPTNPQEEKKVATQASKFKRENSPYLSYNIYNVLNLIKDVKYDDELENWTVLTDLYDAYKGRTKHRDEKEKFLKYCVDSKGGINDLFKWDEIDKLSHALTEKSRKAYFRNVMENYEVAPVPVEDIFVAYEKAKRMEITDAVFAGIKWPEHKEERPIFEFSIPAYNFFDPRLKIDYTHYRVGGAKLDLRAGMDVIAPPAAVVFDFEKGPWFYAAPWEKTKGEPNAWADWKIAYLKIGPLYIEFSEEETYEIIGRTKWEGENYFVKGKGLMVLLKPPTYWLRWGKGALVYREKYYDSIFPQVRKLFNDMKFVRIFSIQMFKNHPRIRAYGVMVPPGVRASVRDSPEEELPPGRTYVKDTKEELDRLSGKTPNIKETAIREPGRNPDEYGDWWFNKDTSLIEGALPWGGLFLVYPTKADGSEWAAELVAMSHGQAERAGIGGIFPSTLIGNEEYDGQIYFDKTSPTTWKAILDGDPYLILEDYKNALTRSHFIFNGGGVLQFEKDDKGNISLVYINKSLYWYPAELENEMKEMLKKIKEEEMQRQKDYNLFIDEIGSIISSVEQLMGKIKESSEKAGKNKKSKADSKKEKNEKLKNEEEKKNLKHEMEEMEKNLKNVLNLLREDNSKEIEAKNQINRILKVFEEEKKNKLMYEVENESAYELKNIAAEINKKLSSYIEKLK